MKKRTAFSLAVIVFSATIVYGLGTAPEAGPAAKPAAVSSVSTAKDFYNLGYKASQAGKYEEAIANFQQAIALKPDYAEAFNMLGFSLRKSGMIPEAFANYETALKLKPNFPEAREYYGEAFLTVGNLKDAMRQYMILEKAKRPEAKELLEKIDAFLQANPGA